MGLDLEVGMGYGVHSTRYVASRMEIYLAHGHGA